MRPLFRRHDVVTYSAVAISLVLLCGYIIAAVFDAILPFRFEHGSNLTGNGTVGVFEVPPWLLRVEL